MLSNLNWSELLAVNRIAKKLNTRPRKRYDYDTPEERFHAA